MAGIVLSGVSAIPLNAELAWLIKWTGAENSVHLRGWPLSPWATWLISVRDALATVDMRYPFLAYGTDWLAFGHFVSAIAFVGLLRDPLRNRWLIDFGLIACALVIPYALVFGALRGIPIGWRMIDCSFGICGAIPLWRCRALVNELERAQSVSSRTPPVG